MDRPVKQRPPLYIVNLQWTPKVRVQPSASASNLTWLQDSAATLKLNGRCDFVLAEVGDRPVPLPSFLLFFAQVLKHLRMKLPEYTPYNDPLLSYATQLHEKEEHTTTRRYK